MNGARSFFFALVALLTACAPGATQTNWQIETSEAVDAVLFVGILAGDPLANERYPNVAAYWLDQLSPATHDALGRLDAELRGRRGSLVGGDLNHLITRTPHRTLDSVIACLEDDEALARTLEESWQGASLISTHVVADDLLTVLLNLREIGFSEHWREDIAPQIEDRISDLLHHVGQYDVISEVSRFFERPVEQDVTVILAYYNQPFGFRIVGQQAYVTNYAQSIDWTVITAVHELFHPPFDIGNQRLWDAASELRSDPWLLRIVENHDPRFTTNSFEALLDEDSTKALDQIATERLGIAVDPATRFRTQDGGMHMLAAALYHAMKETGFAESGGSYEAWLIDALEMGVLSSAEVRRHAALVVGQDAVDRWD